MRPLIESSRHCFRARTGQVEGPKRWQRICRMTVGRMAEVVTQRSESHTVSECPPTRPRRKRLVSEALVERPPREVHGAQGMDEPRVRRTGKGVVRKAELPNSAQPLNGTMGHDPLFLQVEVHRTMDGSLFRTRWRRMLHSPSRTRGLPTLRFRPRRDAHPSRRSANLALHPARKSPCLLSAPAPRCESET